MSKRIKTPQSLGRDYQKMLKDYFGKFLYGLDVEDVGHHVSVQLVYHDFKHIDTVRRELAQMMPEVEFIKIKREYTPTAMRWVICKMMDGYPGRYKEPIIFVQKDDNTLIKSSLFEIATAELNQLELEDDDDIDYSQETFLRDVNATDDEDDLRNNSFE